MKHNITIFTLFLMITILLAACSQGEAPEPETEAPAAEEVAVEPTAVPEPTDAPTEVPPPPTEAPVAEAEVVEEPTAVPPTDVPTEAAATRFGLLRFRDNDTVRAGSIQFLTESVSAPAAGTHYELWLVDDSFNTLNLGQVTAESLSQFNNSTELNLLANYTAAFLSIEPDGVDDGEVGTIILDGLIPAESLLHIRHVVTAFPANPEGKAFLIGAEEQINHAIQHTTFMQEELANGNIREAQRHAEHVINILDGEGGPNFGDLDGDTVAQNPGDGFGVRAYLDGAKQHAQLAVDAEGATAEIKLHADHVLISSDNSLFWLNEAITQALRVIASDSAEEAQPAADEVARLLDLTLNGHDANGDGAVAPIELEGGILTAYLHALNMGSFEFFAADGAGDIVTAAADNTGDEAAAEAEATSEPTAVAPAEEEAAPPAAAPAPVSIDMANFAFQPADITVPAGTTVTWINKDSGPRHSATASDNSFDTGLFEGGQEGSVTFDTPGTFIYYCLLHGSPDGSGMAATITVTE